MRTTTSSTNKTKGVLYDDQDGSGAAAVIQFATVKKSLTTMSYKDFLII